MIQKFLKHIIYVNQVIKLINHWTWTLQEKIRKTRHKNKKRFAIYIFPRQDESWQTGETRQPSYICMLPNFLVTKWFTKFTVTKVLQGSFHKWQYENIKT